MNEKDKECLINFVILFLLVVLFILGLLQLEEHLEPNERDNILNGFCNELGYDKLTDYQYERIDVFFSTQDYNISLECDNEVIKSHCIKYVRSVSRFCKEYDKWGVCKKYEREVNKEYILKEIKQNEQTK